MKIASFLETSTVDYPGKVSAVLWMSGCPFRCPFCQNASVAKGEGSSSVEVADIISKIRPLLSFIDAVTITGGEPTLQGEELLDLLKKLKKMGLLTHINTNGFFPETLSQLIPHLDRVSIDVKNELVPEIYGKTIGRPALADAAVSNLRQSLNHLKNSKVTVEVRTTIVPGLNDDPKIINKISKDVKWAKDYRLRPFHNRTVMDPKFKEIDPPQEALMVSLENSKHS